MNDFGIPTVTSKVQQGMDLIDDMNTQELNALVDYIRVVFKNKRSQDAARTRASLTPGKTRVRLRGIKPQYLNGQTGTVTEARQTRVVVTLDRGPQGKFPSGKVVCSPASFDIIED